MAVVLTAVARVRDWRALRRLADGLLGERARAIGATRLTVYRDAADASLALIAGEFPDREAVLELWREVAALEPLAGAAPETHVWESLGWDAGRPLSGAATRRTRAEPLGEVLAHERT